MPDNGWQRPDADLTIVARGIDKEDRSAARIVKATRPDPVWGISHLKAAFFLVASLSSFFLGSEARAGACSIPYFDFRFTSQGPWPARMTVQSGKSCGSRSWSTGGTLKQLYLASAPRHGKVALSFPGKYRYFPSSGYVGADTFTLKLCGSAIGGFEGCSDLLFNVNVVQAAF
jgi:hypothetical protein